MQSMSLMFDESTVVLQACYVLQLARGVQEGCVSVSVTMQIRAMVCFAVLGTCCDLSSVVCRVRMAHAQHRQLTVELKSVHSTHAAWLLCTLCFVLEPQKRPKRCLNCCSSARGVRRNKHTVAQDWNCFASSLFLNNIFYLEWRLYCS